MRTNGWMHQRIKSWSVWPERDFPRTPSTLKVRRNEVARLLDSAQPALHAQPDLSAMSSLERVELLSELEDRFQMDLDEEGFSRLRTTEELEHWLKQPPQHREATPEREFSVAEWTRRRPFPWLRTALRETIVLPVFRHYLPLTVTGLENLNSVEPPVIFAANHTSNLDAVAVFAALPRHWRNRLAPAMSKDRFRPHFEPDRFPVREVWKWRLGYITATLLFNTYPLPQQMSGATRALKYTGELVSRGYCPLVFPEGTRTPDGQMLPFRPGIGMMAVHLSVPVVPVYIAGLFDVYSIHDGWPKAGPVGVAIGKPMEFPAGTGYGDVAETLRKAIAEIGSGA
jgi:long-chain acyl-CoA synthetase